MHFTQLSLRTAWSDTNIWCTLLKKLFLLFPVYIQLCTIYQEVLFIELKNKVAIQPVNTHTNSFARFSEVKQNQNRSRYWLTYFCTKTVVLQNVHYTVNRHHQGSRSVLLVHKRTRACRVLPKHRSSDPEALSLEWAVWSYLLQYSVSL